MSYVIKMSGDLSHWIPATIMIGAPVDNGDGTETVTVRDLTAASNHACRSVRVGVVIGP